MKAKALVEYDLDDKIFGPMTSDRTRLDILRHASRMACTGTGIRGAVFEWIKFFPKEGGERYLKGKE